MLKKIESPKAPSAIGPYSQGIEANGLLFVSGQIGINVNTGAFLGKDIKSQTRQALLNIKSILEAGGLGLGDVCKTTVFLMDIAEFGDMNEVYAEFFQEPYPARATFQVLALPKGARVEIEAIASK